MTFSVFGWAKDCRALAGSLLGLDLASGDMYSRCNLLSRTFTENGPSHVVALVSVFSENQLCIIALDIKSELLINI